MAAAAVTVINVTKYVLSYVWITRIWNAFLLFVAGSLCTRMSGWRWWRWWSWRIRLWPRFHLLDALAFEILNYLFFCRLIRGRWLIRRAWWFIWWIMLLVIYKLIWIYVFSGGSNRGGGGGRGYNDNRNSSFDRSGPRWYDWTIIFLLINIKYSF